MLANVENYPHTTVSALQLCRTITKPIRAWTNSQFAKQTQIWHWIVFRIRQKQCKLWKVGVRKGGTMEMATVSNFISHIFTTIRCGLSGAGVRRKFWIYIVNLWVIFSVQRCDLFNCLTFAVHANEANELWKNPVIRRGEQVLGVAINTWCPICIVIYEYNIISLLQCFHFIPLFSLRISYVHNKIISMCVCVCVF